jgi:hypothetical protein
MLEDLRRFNNVGNLVGIQFFAEQIFHNDNTTIDGVISICSLNSEIQVNSKIALLLFEYLNIISIKCERFYLTRKGGLFQKKTNPEEIFDLLALITIRSIIANGIITIDNFKVNHASEKLKFEIKYFPLHAAIFRNLLLTINKLKYDGGIYSIIIENGVEKILSREVTRSKRTISEAELLKSLESMKIQGELAEKWVLDYELKRLRYTKHLDKVKIISKIDVGAGFDILSLESENSGVYDRFIEVKSFKCIPQFFWTKNEREVASIKGNNYFIYLVDVDMILNEKYEPIIIQNPHTKLSEGNDWLMESETVKVIRLPK